MGFFVDLVKVGINVASEYKKENDSIKESYNQFQHLEDNELIEQLRYRNQMSYSDKTGLIQTANERGINIESIESYINLYCKIYQDKIEFRAHTSDKAMISSVSNDCFIKKIDYILINLLSPYTLQVEAIEYAEERLERCFRSMKATYTKLDQGIYEITCDVDRITSFACSEFGNSCWPILDGITLSEDELYNDSYRTIWTCE